VTSAATEVELVRLVAFDARTHELYLTLLERGPRSESVDQKLL
jgi:hypothetical protein